MYPGDVCPGDVCPEEYTEPAGGDTGVPPPGDWRGDIPGEVEVLEEAVAGGHGSERADCWRNFVEEEEEEKQLVEEEEEEGETDGGDGCEWWH